MNKLMNILNALTNNMGSIIGGIQALVKFVKELATAIVNLLGSITALFGVNVASVQRIVDMVRNWCNIADGWLEKAKKYFLGLGG